LLLRLFAYPKFEAAGTTEPVTWKNDIPASWALSAHSNTASPAKFLGLLNRALAVGTIHGVASLCGLMVEEGGG
jgi:hypothetical protein